MNLNTVFLVKVRFQKYSGKTSKLSFSINLKGILLVKYIYNKLKCLVNTALFSWNEMYLNMSVLSNFYLLPVEN